MFAVSIQYCVYETTDCGIYKVVERFTSSNIFRSNMKVKYTFLVLIAFFTLAWKLQGVNCENEEPLELHDCLNGKSM